MTNWRTYFTLFLGAFCATAAFIFVGVYFTGSPIGQTILAAHGILVANHRPPLTEEQQIEVITLLRDGYLISSDGLISTMTSFYETLVTVLLGSMVFFGIFSYFGTRLQTKVQIDEVVAERVEHGLNVVLGARKFEEDVRRVVTAAINIELESIQDSIQRIEEFIAAQESALVATAAQATPNEEE